MRLSRNFKYVKANSLVESVIAIAIISICILVAFLIYLNVIKQNKSIHYYEAKHQVESIFETSIMTKNYDDEIFTQKYYSIEKTANISEKEHIIRMDFKIKTSNKTYTINKLIPLHEDETY
jgi:competence protein ComGC